MARAKRYYIPGHVWHLTHRCHKKEFLLKFSRDRQRWLEWLFEAKKRYGIRVLNYMVTSNHIHLLVLDADGRDVIPKSMHLIAGRTDRNIIKGKTGKVHSGKTVIMQLPLNAIVIWLNVSFMLI
jgi:REP element-mobilizing transposase RayT